MQLRVPKSILNIKKILYYLLIFILHILSIKPYSIQCFLLTFCLLAARFDLRVIYLNIFAKISLSVPSPLLPLPARCQAL